ncbi:hypothetical protein G7Y89_g1491 [Cudoniella acicularis]|uniref:FAD/NAD(P)-binding domain-containing protein n=1 Tax=Cudoniella acicularis TaxID=354080 RepID=A0A8H4RV63_9HELO|nr:hypothetical protein G7Y89_g1491 [Cudoniella acicularis]
MSSTEDSTVDVIIIGGGPAGLSAALCLSRARYKTAIFDSGVYRNAAAPHMHMVPTWDHGDPKKYRATARAELSDRYGEVVTFVDLAVTSVKKEEAGTFYAVDSSGQSWRGRKLILATGVKDIFPDIPGYEECWIKGIFHCLFCHGYEDAGVKSIGVLAVDLMAQVPQITNGLVRNALRFSDDVTIYTNGAESIATTMLELVSTADAPQGVKMDSRPIARLTKEDTAAEVTIEFKDGSRITHGFLVHGPRNEMELDFAKDLKLERMPSGGEVKVLPPFNETTEPGCFAAGDIGSVGKIVIAGVAFGTYAAMGVVKQLQGY